MYCSDWPVSERDGDVGIRAKRQSDPDYRENQARSQRAWAQGHRDDWREYRRTHLQYCESNRLAARRRRRGLQRWTRKGGFAVPSGTYRLVPASAVEFADGRMAIENNFDIKSIRGGGEAAEVCKETT
jgi:hypothetical protein